MIVIGGPPCAGKSSVAAALARRLRLPHLSMDATRQRILPGATHTRADREVAYRAMAMAAELLDAAGAGVILDAPYGHPEDRDALTHLSPLWVECRVSPETAVRRLRERGFDPQRPDLTEDTVRETAAAWVYQGLVLDSEKLSVEECVDAIVSSVKLQNARSRIDKLRDPAT